MHNFYNMRAYVKFEKLLRLRFNFRAVKNKKISMKNKAKEIYWQ